MSVFFILIYGVTKIEVALPASAPQTCQIKVQKTLSGTLYRVFRLVFVLFLRRAI